MYKSECVLTNEVHKILCDFKIQMDNTIKTKRLDLVLINKNEKNILSCGFCCSIEPLNENRGCPRGVMVKAMDYALVVSEFVLQSRYYVHFRANTLGKGMNPLSSQLWVK